MTSMIHTLTGDTHRHTMSFEVVANVPVVPSLLHRATVALRDLDGGTYRPIVGSRAALTTDLAVSGSGVWTLDELADRIRDAAVALHDLDAVAYANDLATFDVAHVIIVCDDGRLEVDVPAAADALTLGDHTAARDAIVAAVRDAVDG